MKKLIYIGIMAGSLLLNSSCSDWLDLLPKNEQVTDAYWKSKEDVEAVIASGYYYMRSSCQSLLKWGELRGASICTLTGDKDGMKLQNFQLDGTESICKWENIYQVINMANVVIAHAPGVHEIDDTYTEGAMNAHLSEAYFMRALMYFYLVRNFKEVPLVTTPYEDDSTPFSIAKSSEEEILKQVKADVQTALDSGGAKEFYDNDNWNASKGRVTKWALYALMSEVSLWTEDYDTCIKYADLLINATASRRPAFITIPENWYTIFNPGNSNESIFEVNWDGNTYNQTGGPSAMYTTGTNPNYQYSTKMSEDLENDYMEVITGKDAVRSWYGASIIYNDGENPVYCIWKYKMGDTDPTNLEAMRLKDDANWIIYRMADIMLMKAEALIWKGKENWQEAVDIINQIRTRANLPEKTIAIDEEDESSMMENYLLPERNIELAAEGKRWYDMIRYAKSKNYAHKSAFIALVQQYNTTANASWIRSVLQNEYAWYLPIHADEIENNTLLVQNPYYGITGNN